MAGTYRGNNRLTVIVITASLGRRERRRGLYTPRHDRRSDGVRYLAFVDRVIHHKIWETVAVDPPAGDSCRAAKRFKVLAAEYLAEYGADASIWIDRHCRLTCDPLTVWDQFAESVGVVRHYRRCVYREAAACRAAGKDDPRAIRRTVERWRLEGVRRGGGLFYGGFLLRRHPAADPLGPLWWDYIEDGTRRDQITLPVALIRSGVSVREFRRSRRQEFFKIGGR